MNDAILRFCDQVENGVHVALAPLSCHAMPWMDGEDFGLAETQVSQTASHCLVSILLLFFYFHFQKTKLGQRPLGGL